MRRTLSQLRWMSQYRATRPSWGRSVRLRATEAFRRALQAAEARFRSLLRLDP